MQATPAQPDSDSGTFAEFFTANQAGALRQARRLVDDRATAEDLVAEAFTRMWTRWRTGTIDEPARYLYRVIRNAAADHFRRRARERDTVEKASGAVDLDREQVAAVVEVRAVVGGLLDQLTPRQRRVVSLRYLRDLSEAQTARSLGVSLGTVKSSTSRTLQRLRELDEAERVA